MVYVITSEYDGEVRFLQAHCQQHAIERGQDLGMIGKLNAVQVKDQHQLQARINTALKEIEGTSEQVAFLKSLSATTTKRRIGNQFYSTEATDLKIAGWKFRYFPYARASGACGWSFKAI